MLYSIKLCVHPHLLLLVLEILLKTKICSTILYIQLYVLYVYNELKNVTSIFKGIHRMSYRG